MRPHGLITLAAILVLPSAGCSMSCNAPRPDLGPPSCELSGAPSLPSPPTPMPRAAASAPAASVAPTLPPVPQGPPPRSMSKTRPAIGPEGPSRDLPGPPAEVFARWHPEGALQAMQGSWLAQGWALGQTEAWEVQGTHVRVYDGATVRELELELESPCTVKTVERSASGFRARISVFTVKDGDFWQGLGDAGYRRGAEALLCGHGRIFSTDGERCVSYRPPVGDGPWQETETRCGFDRAEDGSEVFFFQHRDAEYPVYVVGDVLADWQLKGTHSRRHPTFESAKLAVDEVLRERERRVEAAKARRGDR